MKQDPSLVECAIVVNAPVSPHEVMDVRSRDKGDEDTWQKCLDESLCVASARNKATGNLVGIGFLVGNKRHASIVDLEVAPAYRQHGIGGKLLDSLIKFAEGQNITYLGLTFDKQNSPWLQAFYERHGFVSIDFAMWHRSSIDRFANSTNGCS